MATPIVPRREEGWTHGREEGWTILSLWPGAAPRVPAGGRRWPERPARQRDLGVNGVYGDSDSAGGALGRSPLRCRAAGCSPSACWVRRPAARLLAAYGIAGVTTRRGTAIGRRWHSRSASSPAAPACTCEVTAFTRSRCSIRSGNATVTPKCRETCAPRTVGPAGCRPSPTASMIVQPGRDPSRPTIRSRPAVPACSTQLGTGGCSGGGVPVRHPGLDWVLGLRSRSWMRPRA